MIHVSTASLHVCPWINFASCLMAVEINSFASAGTFPA